jgi:hypothetical protein
VDWPLIREKNLGCKEAVSLALDCFSRHEEEGIILEDDCLPAKEFSGFAIPCLNVTAPHTRVRTSEAATCNSAANMETPLTIFSANSYMGLGKTMTKTLSLSQPKK